MQVGAPRAGAWAVPTWFSHPAVDAFVMWGIWDESHWHENAPLFRADWSPEPAYDVSTDLVFGKWWIDRTDTADAGERYTADTVLGAYDVTARANGRTTTKTVALADPTGDRVTTRLERSG